MVNKFELSNGLDYEQKITSMIILNKFLFIRKYLIIMFKFDI